MVDIQAVVFDLYGTLIYLERSIRPHLKLFQDLGINTPEDLKKAKKIALTEPFDSIVDLVNNIASGTEVDVEQYQKEIEKEIASVHIYPETIQTLEKLKDQGIKLGLISNLASQYKHPFLDLGLDQYFDHVMLSCDVGLKKPEPEIYEGMIHHLKVNPEQALMVGDTIIPDVEGPISLGMNAVHLDRKYNSPDSISTLEGVSKLLELYHQS